MQITTIKQIQTAKSKDNNKQAPNRIATTQINTTRSNNKQTSSNQTNNHQNPTNHNRIAQHVKTQSNKHKQIQQTNNCNENLLTLKQITKQLNTT